MKDRYHWTYIISNSSQEGRTGTKYRNNDTSSLGQYIHAHPQTTRKALEDLFKCDACAIDKYALPSTRIMVGEVINQHGLRGDGGGVWVFSVGGVEDTGIIENFKDSNDRFLAQKHVKWEAVERGAREFAELLDEGREKDLKAGLGQYWAVPPVYALLGRRR
ncbi:hypothetical protein BBP40_011486 [Aspergillus hancockii]|nr:hypothetical protein BBP40_011486 [Aspergillus hancockii]